MDFLNGPIKANKSYRQSVDDIDWMEKDICIVPKSAPTSEPIKAKEVYYRSSNGTITCGRYEIDKAIIDISNYDIVDCPTSEVTGDFCCPETNSILTDIKDLIEAQSDSEFQETFMIDPDTEKVVTRTVEYIDGVKTVKYENQDGTPYTGPTNNLIPHMIGTPAKIAEHWEGDSITLAPEVYEGITYTVLEGSYEISIDGVVIIYEAGLHPSVAYNGVPRITSEFVFTANEPGSRILVNTIK
jgi:hypothetical protein